MLLMELCIGQSLEQPILLYVEKVLRLQFCFLPMVLRRREEKMIQDHGGWMEVPDVLFIRMEAHVWTTSDKSAIVAR
jgi:hypothetical protein